MDTDEMISLRFAQLAATCAGADDAAKNADSGQAGQGNVGAMAGLAKTIKGRLDSRGRDAAKEAIPPTHGEVRYGPHERNVLDFWKAESDTPTPLVVYIHGGGFVGGDKSEFVRHDPGRVQRCLEKGVSVAAINYPFVLTTDLLTIMHDTARAVQFLRHQAAEWNIDRTRVASCGMSAGAGASLWLAFHDDLADTDNADPVLRESTRIVAAAVHAPQATYDFPQWPTYLILPPWLWPTSSGIVCPMYYHMEKEEIDSEAGARMRKELDILSLIDQSDPPVLLRTNRDNVPSQTWDNMLHHPGHGIKLRDTCQARGVPCILNEKETPKEARVDMLDFLFEHLGVLAKAGT
jgi:hypothetical protein